MGNKVFNTWKYLVLFETDSSEAIINSLFYFSVLIQILILYTSVCIPYIFAKFLTKLLYMKFKNLCFENSKLIFENA